MRSLSERHHTNKQHAPTWLEYRFARNQPTDRQVPGPVIAFRIAQPGEPKGIAAFEDLFALAAANG